MPATLIILLALLEIQITWTAYSVHRFTDSKKYNFLFYQINSTQLFLHNLISSYLVKILLTFYCPVISTTYSQDAGKELGHKPELSIPHTSVLFFEDFFNIILPYIYIPRSVGWSALQLLTSVYEFRICPKQIIFPVVLILPDLITLTLLGKEYKLIFYHMSIVSPLFVSFESLCTLHCCSTYHKPGNCLNNLRHEERIFRDTAESYVGAIVNSDLKFFILDTDRSRKK